MRFLAYDKMDGLYHSSKATTLRDNLPDAKGDKTPYKIMKTMKKSIREEYYTDFDIVSEDGEYVCSLNSILKKRQNKVSIYNIDLKYDVVVLDSIYDALRYMKKQKMSIGNKRLVDYDIGFTLLDEDMIALILTGKKKEED
jgi:hypothetical protein